MFTDSNNSGDDSFTVPSSDQSLFYSKLLNEMAIDDYNPFSSPCFTSFCDQFSVDYPLFVSSHLEEQEPEDDFLLFNHQELQPALTTSQDFTTMATRSNAAEGHSKTENFRVSSSNAKRGTEASAGKLATKSRGNSSKDRHSKIITAQGPRDRRMRLSLDIARRFFGLQDMLGFDKASKTIEWLLSNSQSEINKVARSKNIDTSNSVTTKSDSFSASECCEEVSQVVNESDEIQPIGATNTDMESYKKSSSKERKSSRASLPSRKEGLNKESREKARARARERTTEKRKTKNCFAHMDFHMLLLASQVEKPAAAAFFLGTHGDACIDRDCTMAIQYESSVKNIIDWNSSSTILNHLQEHDNNDTTRQMQFGDNQFYARSPWDVYH